MSAKQYFKQSNYSELWSKAVRTYDSLAEVLHKHVAIINALPGSCLLDIGVGEGRYILSCAKAGLKICVGLDVSKETLLQAKSNLMLDEYDSVFLVQGDAERLPFRKEVFDKIICVGTSWYLPNLPSFLFEISRVSKLKCMYFGDFMNSSNEGINRERTKRVIMNSFLKHTKNFQGISLLVSYADSMLDLFYRSRQYGHDKSWLISYFKWGVTPFHPAPFFDIISLFKFYGLEIIEVVGDENAPLICIKASKLASGTKQP